MEFIAVGTKVHPLHADLSIDFATTGTVIEFPAVDPEGVVHYGLATVDWQGIGTEIEEVADLTTESE